LLAVVPTAASITAKSVDEPKWQRCSPGSGSGFGPASLTLTFTSSSSTQDVVRFAQPAAAKAGWRLTSDTTGRLAELRWQRVVVIGGEQVTLSGALSQTERGPGVVDWTLAAFAPPRVQPLTGC
jgi:hypothetical protein